MLAAPIDFAIDPLSWEIIERIHLGPVAISPHGIGIALGYLAGAQLMVRRARRAGAPPEQDIWSALFYALLGAIVGARAGYVFGHFSEVTDGGSDLLGILRIYEGGISLIGGITGAILFALPYILRRGMGFWPTMDAAAPGLALGIVIGRVGDLMIGDHLGKPTTFPLGWLCKGEAGGGAPASAELYRSALARGNPPSLGCFDLVLHQTALYDLFSTLTLLGLLLWVGRKLRRPGFMIGVFAVWYGTMRVVTDFLRVDRRYFGLTGSQLMSLAVVTACAYLLVRYRGAPPRWAGGAPRGAAEDDLPDPDSASDQEKRPVGGVAGEKSAPTPPEVGR